MSLEQHRPLERLPRAACCAVVMSCGACISTDLPASGSPPICTATRGDGGGPDAVVQITSHLADQDMWCSGVAIAPSLVLTTLGCVAEPSDPREADPVEEPTLFGGAPASSLTFSPVDDYASICDGSAGWALSEDGTFAGWLGDLLAPTAIDVTWLPPNFDPEQLQTIKAAEVFTSRSGTRCRDDIALLRLEEPSIAPPVTLQLGGDAVGQRVTLSNLCNDDGILARKELSSEIRALSGDAAEPLLPPRSLAIAAELDDNAPGGAVLAAETAGLLGVVVSASRAACSEQSTEGTTIAARLAAFQGMLLQAASVAHEVLRVEPGATDPTFAGAPECPSP